MGTIRRVAVLGAGTMGSRIAAHFANAGVPVLLLDVVAPDAPSRNHRALHGIESAATQRPPAFFTDAARALITPGNFDDDLGAIQNCGWVVEAVAEKLDVKRALLERVALWRRPGTIVSTNTSGIPLASIAEGFSSEFRRCFLGAHFFNPPRYLYLVEVIPGPETGGEALGAVTRFCEDRLGKGVVVAKDTPNFIANRIGAFFVGTALRLAAEQDLSVEEVDVLTGPLIGLPRSGTFRLLDIIGLDVWSHLSENLYTLAPGDPWRERFRMPEFLRTMIERGRLGDKAGQGFYRRTGPQKQMEALDWKTLEYRSATKPSLPEVEVASRIDAFAERLRALTQGSGRAGSFLWPLLRDLLLYAASRVPEISDRIVELDRAMRWGYAHRLGPFELWDALGVEATVARMRQEGCEVPSDVERMLAAGATSFYRTADSGGLPRTAYFDLGAASYTLLEDRPGVLVLADVKRARGVVREGAGASLIDLNGGVLCLEFHGPANRIGEEQLDMLRASIAETMRSYAALVITSRGDHFSTGTDLAPILRAAEDARWEEIDAALRRSEQAHLAIKYASRPVVAAPFGLTLGAGCTAALHARRIQASAELSIGPGEISAGLIPAGGGSKEILLRLGDAARAFAVIAFGRASASAAEAREMGLLRPGDAVSMNPQKLLGDARALALILAPSYAARVPPAGIPVAGETGFRVLVTIAQTARQSGRIDADQFHVLEKLAWVLSGGTLRGPAELPEQAFLDLEREAFLSLCGEPWTRERMARALRAP